MAKKISTLKAARAAVKGLAEMAGRSNTGAAARSVRKLKQARKRRDAAAGWGTSAADVRRK